LISLDKSDKLLPMLVSVNVPDQIAAQLRLGGESGNRRALEMFALEGYRAGELSRGQVSELLEMEFNETEGFLKAHQAFIPLTLDEIHRASASLERLLAQ
jgi:predicted HTH domain antitoxin